MRNISGWSDLAVIFSVYFIVYREKQHNIVIYKFVKIICCLLHPPICLGKHFARVFCLWNYNKVALCYRFRHSDDAFPVRDSIVNAIVRSYIDMDIAHRLVPFIKDKVWSFYYSELIKIFEDLNAVLQWKWRVGLSKNLLPVYKFIS